MERLTFEGNFCDIARCGYPTCPYKDGCSQKQVWERLKQYEDTGLSPEKVSWMKEVVEAAFDNDTSRIERAHNLHVDDKEGRAGGFAQSAERNGGYEGWLNRYFFWSYAI